MAKKWTRDELMIALGLYCKLPFGQFHSRNPLIIEVAEEMGRAANSVAMKLSNLASLDPVITESGRKGLQGASALDREVWAEFSEDTEEKMPEAEDALQAVLSGAKEQTEILPIAYEEDDHFAKTKVRKGQNLFRDAVLSAYDGRCCVTGMTDHRFLIASHIRPWRKDKENRLNPRNGLCLSLMVDKAFDLGLITFSGDFRLVISDEIKEQSDNDHVAETFLKREGSLMTMPNKFSPDEKFLSWHRENYFVGRYECR